MTKSKDLIKKHTESITHNTLGNIITIGLASGGAAMMSALATYSGFISGLPLYSLIFLGAVIFLIFAAALNFIHLFVVRRRQLKAASIDETGLQTAESDEKRIESLNAQRQSEIKTLTEKIESLQGQADELKGRKAQFEQLQRDCTNLRTQNNGLHAQLARQCWLYNRAGKQGEQIDRYVILDRIVRGDAKLHDLDGWPFIRFHFYIVNKSVFDITVELDNGASDSYIVFNDKGLSERFIGIPNNQLYIPYYTEGCLTIEQQLSAPQAHFLNRSMGQDDAIFHFDRLVITINARNQEPEVKEQRLVIDKSITINNELLPHP